VVYRRAVAEISSDTAQTIVLHRELSPTMAAAQETSQQSTTIAHRPGHHGSFHIGIVSDKTQVAFKLLPGDVALMVVADQYAPFLLVTADAHLDHLASRLHHGARHRATEDIGSSIDRICQDPVH
jgi:hypothetical protein